MRLVVDLTRNDEDQVCGAVRAETGQRAVAFSGWLEFVRVLEAFAEEPAIPGPPAAPPPQCG